MQDYVLGKDVLIYFKWDVGRRYVVWRMVAGQEPGMEEEHGQEEEAGHAEVPISCFQVGCWKLVVLLCVVKKINKHNIENNTKGKISDLPRNIFRCDSISRLS